VVRSPETKSQRCRPSVLMNLHDAGVVPTFRVKLLRVKEHPRSPRRRRLVELEAGSVPAAVRITEGEIIPLGHDVQVQWRDVVDAHHAGAAGRAEDVAGRVVPWSPDRLALLVKAVGEFPVCRVLAPISTVRSSRSPRSWLA
jgi:hypothetical protein